MDRKNDLYEFQYISKKYINDDIINLLNIYKKYRNNKESFSNNDISKINNNLKSTIQNIKSRIIVNEELYKRALKYNNNEALRITFENENSEENIILKRIIDYDLFKKSIDSENYDYVKKILGYKPFHYMCSDYEYIISDVIDKYMVSSKINLKKNIAKLIIEKFIENSVSIYNKNNSSNQLSQRGIPFKNLVLNIAIKKENLDAVKYISDDEDYTELNTKDILGNYPIMVSLDCESIDIFEYLIDTGIDCNIKNNSNISLLTLAINKNKIDSIKYILKYRSKIIIDTRESNNCTPLETSINQNNDSIVQLLLNYANKHNINIDINKKNYLGNYPLIDAINKKNYSMVFAIVTTV